jgi:hypothetical protein
MCGVPIFGRHITNIVFAFARIATGIFSSIPIRHIPVELKRLP